MWVATVSSTFVVVSTIVIFWKEKKKKGYLINLTFNISTYFWANYANSNRFKRLTGRNEVAVSARDYKFYAPRHKYRRVASSSVSSIPGLPVSFGLHAKSLALWLLKVKLIYHILDVCSQTFPGSDDSSPMATAQGYRSISEVMLFP